MTESREHASPFAGESRQAAEGHIPPEADTGASGRGESNSRAENVAPRGGEGVSGRAVHTRIGGADVDAPTREHEKTEQGMPALGELRTNIEACRTHLRLLEVQHSGTVSIGDIDGVPFTDYVAAEYARAKTILDTDPAEITSENFDELQVILENFRGFISDIEAGIRETVKATEPQERGEECTPRVKKRRGAKGQTTPPEASTPVDAHLDTGRETKLMELRGLMDRWKTLQSEFADGELLRATQRVWKKEGVAPMKKAGEWLSADQDSRLWGRQGQEYFVHNILPLVEEWISEAEHVAARLRQQAKKPKAARGRQPGTSKAAKRESSFQAAGDLSVSPESVEGQRGELGKSVAAATPMEPPQTQTEAVIEPAVVTSHTSVHEQGEAGGDVSTGAPMSPNNVVTMTGRRVEGDGLTAWERMDVGQQNAIMRGLFKEKDSFITELNATLKKVGGNTATREQVIMDALHQFLEPLISELPLDITLTSSDREDIMARLLKERAIKP